MPNNPVLAAATGLPASTRKKVERALDKLIAVLDACDPDPDLEPSLGSDPYGSQDLEGDTSDDEPSLGATEALNQERAWRPAVVTWIDLEFDGDTCPDADKEPDADGEPWLAGCPMDGGRDLEWDQAEDGIGDSDGLIEQCGRFGEHCE